MKTGADALIAASHTAGIEVCFANPGTTEMGMVNALASSKTIRPVLALFEGVASGAADGYARIAGKPAAVMLHLGPGLGNATANLHNARRARTPVVSWVGDHTTWLLPHDPPLTSDIAAIAKGTSQWIRTTQRIASVGEDAVAAVRAAYGPPGGVATLIVPADHQESALPEGFALPADTHAGPRAEPLAKDAVERAARRLTESRKPALLLGGPATHLAGLRAAARVARVTGAKLLLEQFPARLRREPGMPQTERLAYLPQMARAQLTAYDVVAPFGTERPVCFFGYDGEAPELTAAGSEILDVTGRRGDAVLTLEALADALDAPAYEPSDAAPAQRQPLPTGKLDAAAVCASLAEQLPEDAIVVDEAITASLPLHVSLGTAAPHDYLSFKGGSIGAGTPCATGAAVAAPERRVVAYVGDGSAMYTLQSLWTQAREGLNVTTIIAVNAKYAILQLEIMRAGGRLEGAGSELTEIAEPPLDFVHLATGFGVPARRATTAEEFNQALKESFQTPGPMLIAAHLGE